MPYLARNSRWKTGKQGSSRASFRLWSYNGIGDIPAWLREIQEHPFASVAVEQHNPCTLSPALFSVCAADPNEKYQWQIKKGPGYQFIFFGINRVIPTSDSIPQGCQFPLNSAFIGQYLKSVSEVNHQNCHQSFISISLHTLFLHRFKFVSSQVKTPRHITQKANLQVPFYRFMMDFDIVLWFEVVSAYSDSKCENMFSGKKKVSDPFPREAELIGTLFAREWLKSNRELKW